jgi:guanylate kinase
MTTRAPREGEVDGVDYRFVSESDFRRRVEAGEMAEWARVFDASYGTPRDPVERSVAAGTDILLDIDIQGARKLRERYRIDTVTMFVLPPSFAELEGRLRRRGTDDPSSITRRLTRAHEEASAYSEYDYLIINADLEQSLAQLGAVVEAERLRVDRLRAEFAPWKS